MVMERMDPNTLNLMKKLKELLDPNGIMNPGNWEAK
jgi:glycolate oxidase